MNINDNEAQARLIINEKIKNAGWHLIDTKEFKRNVNVEQKAGKDFEDYEFLDSNGKPLCVLEAKKPSINPLSAKEQARKYANERNIRFVILSNGLTFYFWDIKNGNPYQIIEIPTQKSLEGRIGITDNNKKDISTENIVPEYVALQKNPRLLEEPEYIDENQRNSYCWKNGYRILRDYQIGAVKAIQNAIIEGKDRFLIEMATGLGKTLTSGAIIQMLLKTRYAHRVLFLVDRIELEQQAYKNFNDYLCNFTTFIYKDKSKEWQKADIVISTIQTLLSNDRYKSFSPTDFDFIISDEAHRSIGGNSRAVFEYFIGYKLGLTATPKDYMKNVNLDKVDSASLEIRLLRDTYKTFGCENSEPTYKYSLVDGVKNGYLIAPEAIDARTDITTKLLSKKGYDAIGVDENGNNVKETVVAKQFEKKFFNENINRVLSKTFMENAERDPISNEIGKSLVFCVSQEHALKVTQILNEFAMKMYPGKYNSDFAVQVTSNVRDAQQMTNQFSNNNLSGKTAFLEGYESSKTRVCVTVSMMTTGYDCSDLQNIVFMRPVFSPTDFVQMKGRGTRKHSFKYKDVFNNEIKREKKTFKLFDFFGNCEFFEKEFNYNEKLKLPSGGGGGTGEPPNPIPTLTSNEIDILIQKENIIPTGIMRIDQEYWGNFKQKIETDVEIKNAVEAENWDYAVSLLKEKYENKPNEYFNLNNIETANKLDRHLSWREVLENIFNLKRKFKTLRELLDDEYDKYALVEKPNPELSSSIRNFIRLYPTNERFRNYIDSKEYAGLKSINAGFDTDDIKSMGIETMTNLITYIKENIMPKNYEVK